jgi:hypothetical protein
MSDDMRPYAVDLYDGDQFLETVLVDAPLGARVERHASYVEQFAYVTFDKDTRRVKATLQRRVRAGGTR